MRKYEPVVSYREKLVSIVCDRCGCTLHGDERGDVIAVTISSKHTDGYDEYGEERQIDLCHACAKVIEKAVNSKLGRMAQKSSITRHIA